MLHCAWRANSIEVDVFLKNAHLVLLPQTKRDNYLINHTIVKVCIINPLENGIGITNWRKTQELQSG